MTIHAFDFEIEDEAADGGSRIRLIAFDDIKLGTERRYLVKGLIPRTGLVIVWGPPKSGKSFWTFDLVMHVALGWPYRGRRVDAGAVIYCAFEGQTGVEARCAAFRKKFMADHDQAVPFYLEPVTLDLVKDAPELTRVVRQTLGSDIKPAVIVLDTLNRSLRGSESSDEDMSAYVRAADSLRETFACAVVIVHHCGIDGSRPRGHTSLTGAADARLSVNRDAAGNIIVTLEYAKDGPQGDTVVSRLEVIEVGNDDDGNPITSCVVAPAETETFQLRTERKDSDTSRTFRDAFAEALLTAGQLVRVRGDGPAVKAVSVEIVRQQFYARWATGETDAKKRGNAQRQAFRRALHSLKGRFAVCVQDGTEWIFDPNTKK